MFPYCDPLILIDARNGESVLKELRRFTEIKDMRWANGRSTLFVLFFGWLLSQCLGCSALPCAIQPAPIRTWPDPTVLRVESSIRSDSLAALANAEFAYAAATEAMKKGDSVCVDKFYCAAQYAWPEVETTAGDQAGVASRAVEIYQASLNGLVSEGQRHKRLDARHGLRICTAGGWFTVPIIHHGFPRSSNDFNELVVVDEYSTHELNNIYRRPGVGVPVVAVRRLETSEPFQRNQQAFPATFVLRRAADGVSRHEGTTVLELYDPLRISNIASNEKCLPLAIDSTAPIARALSTVKRTYVRSFLQPGLVKPDDEGLFMLEPYQPGKIPVVFVHGLLSDRLTWANMVNELNARPEFVDRYQIWGFEYPTGEPFLTSATLLRSQLEQVRSYFDPDETDKALSQVVLVGHSMGGLISKMQITESDTALWHSLSNCRFERIAMQPDTRRKFAKAVFFLPSPMVSRVVFIGTPHRGSALAQRAVGRVGSLLIEEPEGMKAEHDRLLNDNPGAFSQEFTRRVPTSIDMLEPDSKLLQAINGLKVNPCVRIHSIVGHGSWMLGNGDSDGVVPVSSAKHDRSTSETIVTAKHAKLTEDPEVIQQVLSILSTHQQEFPSITE